MCLSFYCLATEALIRCIPRLNSPPNKASSLSDFNHLIIKLKTLLIQLTNQQTEWQIHWASLVEAKCATTALKDFIYHFKHTHMSIAKLEYTKTFRRISRYGEWMEDKTFSIKTIWIYKTEYNTFKCSRYSKFAATFKHETMHTHSIFKCIKVVHSSKNVTPNACQQKH